MGNYNPTKYSLDEILVENSNYTNMTKLKERIIRAGLLEYRCAFCGNTGEWNGKHLTLQIDHINGDHHDHRLSNLRLLCPNCHSQTYNYAGRGQSCANNNAERLYSTQNLNQ